MNSEEKRLETFSIWPTNAPVSSAELASHGFFATGNFLEVECSSCHCRISDWDYGDQIQQKHRLQNTHCEFLNNYSNCGNVALDIRPTSSTSNQNTSSALQPMDLLIESHRLATFKNWPNPNISPNSLAKAGFFYLNRSDEVKCAWCNGVIAQWEKQDNAFDEHRRFFPDCPRVQLGPLIEIASDGIRDLGIQQITPPKNPKFSSLDARIRTYANWPICEIQKPDALAQAGLYYQEVDDQVRCFHCNMGLRSWEIDDDPFFEHAKWYPMCDFVRLVKGVKYIEEVQELTRKTQQPVISTVRAKTIDEAMTTSPVTQALEMGVDVGAIRKKTVQRIERIGSPYETVEELLKAVFDDDTENHAASGCVFGNECEGIPNKLTENLSAADNNTIDFNGTSSDNNGQQSEICKKSTDFERKSITNMVSDNHICKTEDTTEICTSRLSLEEENRALKDARLCKVCLDEEVGVVYLPCGHLVSCVQCAPGVTQCPMCRTSIKGFVRTYLS